MEKDNNAIKNQFINQAALDLAVVLKQSAHHISRYEVAKTMYDAGYKKEQYATWIPDMEYFDEETGISMRAGLYQVGWKCSNCGRNERHKEPYCNCGSKMIDFNSNEKAATSKDIIKNVLASQIVTDDATIDIDKIVDVLINANIYPVHTIPVYQCPVEIGDVIYYIDRHNSITAWNVYRVCTDASVRPKSDDDDTPVYCNGWKVWATGINGEIEEFTDYMWQYDVFESFEKAKETKIKRIERK